MVLLDHFDHGLLDVMERVGRIDRRLELVDALCDIRDGDRVGKWFDRVRPDVVIHAAALKHVHLGERHPGECVLTNLAGVRNVLAAAHDARAEIFTLVSSDKAASPVCVMGATKRLAELHLLGFQQERATAMTLKSVRFGNVVGSQGSVLPRFGAQIAAGGPLEVTHPEMERFFMSLEEAVGLILGVTRSDDGSGAYFMEMGDPVSILDLGRQMIARSGRKISIEFTGLRPGEKLKEQLFDAFEAVAEASLPGVFKVAPRSLRAALGTREVDDLERVARTADDAVVLQRVFAHLDARLEREELAVG
ncbi:MAG: polysaccharide biosynthesis protein [Proteobacteria bacterium]|nr:polysaccharide biosynthesis protein [Pseudomonadota bacterium]